MLVTYRGLDTLGEVAVLFISAAGVGLLLRRREDEAEEKVRRTPSSELVQTGIQFLLPLIFLLRSTISSSYSLFLNMRICSWIWD